jgi:NADPH-dependent ferric siderophore reductase
VTTPASPATTGSEGRPPRRRKIPKRVEVVSVARVAPRLISVWVGGEGLEAFAGAAPTSHLKLFLPPAGTSELLLPADTPEGPVWEHDEALRPVVRTYTPRRYDAARGTLEIQFVLHGTGPASEWAQKAQPGDQAAVAGPGGRFSLDEAAAEWWMAADESALPALGTLLEALPASVTARVHVEVDGPDDEIPLPSAARTAVTWHHRRPQAWGTTLLEAAGVDGMSPNARIWVACEAAAMRGIRRRLIAERPMPASFMITRGYWRAGERNYPDHDYGDD